MIPSCIVLSVRLPGRRARGVPMDTPLGLCAHYPLLSVTKDCPRHQQTEEYCHTLLVCVGNELVEDFPVPVRGTHRCLMRPHLYFQTPTLDCGEPVWSPRPCEGPVEYKPNAIMYIPGFCSISSARRVMQTYRVVSMMRLDHPMARTYHHASRVVPSASGSTPRR